MANLKDLIYLSNEDYETLVSSGTVTIQGDTLTYDDANLYVTPDKVASQTEDGLMSAADKAKLDNDVVTKTYYAVNQSTGGIVKVDSSYGIDIDSTNHVLKLVKATTDTQDRQGDVETQANVNKVLTPDQIGIIVRTGLVNSANSSLWTAADKEAARQLLGTGTSNITIEASEVNGNLTVNDVDITIYDDSSLTSAVNAKEPSANKTSTLSSTPGNTKFPTEKLLYDLLPKVIR